MAKKTTAPKAAPAAKASAPVDATVAKTTPVRNSPIPKADSFASAPRKEITHEAIAKRASRSRWAGPAATRRTTGSAPSAN